MRFIFLFLSMLFIGSTYSQNVPDYVKADLKHKRFIEAVSKTYVPDSLWFYSRIKESYVTKGTDTSYWVCETPKLLIEHSFESVFEMTTTTTEYSGVISFNGNSQDTSTITPGISSFASYGKIDTGTTGIYSRNINWDTATTNIYERKTKFHKQKKVIKKKPVEYKPVEKIVYIGTALHQNKTGGITAYTSVMYAATKSLAKKFFLAYLKRRFPYQKSETYTNLTITEFYKYDILEK